MHALTARIDALRRELIVRQRATAACWTVAMVVAAAIALGLLDYWLRYTDRGLQVLATAALAGVAGWAVYRWWLRPGRIGTDSISVARRVEQAFPQLRDSLASAVDFLKQSEDDATAGSAQLRRVVVAEAETAVADLSFKNVIDNRPLRRAALWAGGALAVVILGLALDAGAVGTAFARLVVPWGNVEWPREHYLEFIDPPRRLAIGQTFEAKLVDRSGRMPDDVRLEYRWVERGRQQIVAEGAIRAGDASVARRENVRQSFSFRATGGDDLAMRWIDVEVVEPPRAETLTVTVYPPAYTSLPPSTAERHIEAIAGSRLEISGLASAPLRGARVLVEGGDAIEAEISGGDSADLGRKFTINPQNWAAAASGKCQLELESADGVSGIAATWQLHVRPDVPPTVTWRFPSEDIYVLRSATVPLALLVKDDVGIQSVDVSYERVERGGGSETDESSAPRSGKFELFRGADPATAAAEESRIVEGAWPLTTLALQPGDGLVLRGVARDYQPAEGQVATARRLAVITIEELDVRLAEKQKQIVEQLERALSGARAARAEIDRLAIQLRDSGGLSAGDRNALAAAELNQRRVRSKLTSNEEGVPAMASALLADLKMNGVASPEVEAAMRGLQTALDDLAGGPLGTAERELTSARKSADAMAAAADSDIREEELPPPSFEPVEQQAPRPLPSDGLGHSLDAIGASQEEVIAALERLAAQLSDAADMEQLVRQLAELRNDEITLEKTTRVENDPATLPLEPRELTGNQRANLNKAASGQAAIARRFERIEQSLRRLADELDLKDAAASNALRDAGALSAERLIAANMQETARHLGENRVGRGLLLQQQIAADLEQVLNLLRNRAPRREDRLAGLKQAEAELAKLREQVAAHREQVAQAEAQGNRPAGERQRLGQQQGELQKEAERLARQMNRLEAAEAGQNTQQAAGNLNPRPPGANPNAPPQQPGKSEQVKQAEQKLEEAARQLAEQRARAELDLALEFINRFRGELEQMIARQKTVIADTMEIDAARQAGGALSAADAGRIELLAIEERALAALAVEQRELLMGLAAVRISLQEAEARLIAAADLLAGKQSGPRVQDAERQALARLEAMMEAFAQTAQEAQPKPPGNNPGGGNPPGGPQRRPAFELLEVKMLRMLQVELNQRTEAYQARLAAAGALPNEADRAALARESQELSAQQRQLAELVQEMLSRNNREQQGD